MELNSSWKTTSSFKEKRLGFELNDSFFLQIVEEDEKVTFLLMAENQLSPLEPISFEINKYENVISFFNECNNPEQLTESSLLETINDKRPLFGQILNYDVEFKECEKLEKILEQGKEISVIAFKVSSIESLNAEIKNSASEAFKEEREECVEKVKKENNNYGFSKETEEFIDSVIYKTVMDSGFLSPFAMIEDPKYKKFFTLYAGFLG